MSPRSPRGGGRPNGGSGGRSRSSGSSGGRGNYSGRKNTAAACDAVISARLCRRLVIALASALNCMIFLVTIALLRYCLWKHRLKRGLS